MKNGYLDKNPAEGMQVPSGKRDDEYRDVYDTADLTKIFRSSEYLQDTHRNSYAFWMPILALFTGCRLEELAQLHLSDIRDEDGITVIDINNDGEKKLQTKAALRIIPIHTFLLNDLNFMAYIERLKGKGEIRLFPELRQRRDVYGQTVSKPC